MNDRFRLFTLVLYKESDKYDFNDVLKNIKSYRFYAYIKHDKDVFDDGTDKQVHYHFIIKLDNASTIKALSKKIGVPENYIQHVRNERAMIRYLIHFDDDDKFQYDFNSIHYSRNYQRFVKKCFDDKETEDIIISNINNFINRLGHVEYSTAVFSLVAYVNDNCYETIYKRYRNEFLTILKMAID